MSIKKESLCEWLIERLGLIYHGLIQQPECAGYWEAHYEDEIEPLESLLALIESSGDDKPSVPAFPSIAGELIDREWAEDWEYDNIPGHTQQVAARESAPLPGPSVEEIEHYIDEWHSECSAPATLHEERCGGCTKDRRERCRAAFDYLMLPHKSAPLLAIEEAIKTIEQVFAWGEGTDPYRDKDDGWEVPRAALAVLKAALSKQGPTSKDKIKCPHCQGSGDAAVYTGISETCETCKGTGEVDGPLEDQRLPCPGSKHQPSPPAEPTAGEPATRDIGKAEAVAYFDDLVSWMRKCPIPLPIDEEGIAAIRALILAPPVTVTKEWVESLIATNMPRYVSRAETMLREKGVIVEEKP